MPEYRVEWSVEVEADDRSAGLDPTVQTQAGRETSTAWNSFPV